MGADAVTPTAAAALAPADIAAVTAAMAAARALASMYTAYGSAFGNVPLLQSLAAPDS